MKSAIWPMLWKEFIQMRRDRFTLAMMFGIPESSLAFAQRPPQCPLPLNHGGHAPAQPALCNPRRRQRSAENRSRTAKVPQRLQRFLHTRDAMGTD